MGITDIYKQNNNNSTIGFRNKQMIVLLPATFILFGFSIFWLWAYLTLLQDVFQSVDFERTWCYSRMFFNLLTLSVPDVTPGCFSICWLWAYLMLLQDVFQSFGFERTWCYSRMFFNLLNLSVPDVTPGCFSIFWLWAYLMLLQDVFQSFDFERTWCYSRMFFNLLTLSVPDVTPGYFSRRAFHVCIIILLLTKQMFLNIYHITSVFQMKLAIVLLMLGICEFLLQWMVQKQTMFL